RRRRPPPRVRARRRKQPGGSGCRCRRPRSGYSPWQTRSAARQVEREAAPPADLAVEMDAASMRLHDVADDGEAEPSCPPSPLVALHEPFEYPLALLPGDARAAVRDDDPNRALIRDRLHRHAAATRCVTERVRDQVRKRPGQLRGVPGDRQPASWRRGLESDPSLRRLEREELPDAREHCPEVDRLALQCNRHRTPARHLAEPLRHVLEPRDIALDGGHEVAATAVPRLERPLRVRAATRPPRRPSRGSSARSRSSTAIRWDASGVRSSWDSVAINCSRRASWSRRWLTSCSARMWPACTPLGSL